MSAFAEIISISRRADATVLVAAELRYGDECEPAEFVILDELFSSLDVCAGETDGEILCMLERYAEVTSAYMSACASFAYAPSSLRALYIKLVGKGFSREASADAVNIVRARGFVDEEAIAHRRAELMLKKLWGRGRILRKLRDEGFPDDAVLGVASKLEDVDFADKCASLIRKKYSCLPNDRRERDRMCASLSRFGYSSAEIKKAMRDESAPYEDE